MIVKKFGAASTSSGITTTGKSAKILNGVNQYSLRAYSGQKIGEDVRTYSGYWTAMRT